MEPNGLHSGFFSGIGSGMLGLEKSLHAPPPASPRQQQQQQQQNPQNSHIQYQTNPPNPHHYSRMVAYSHQHDTQAHQSVKQHGYLFTTKPKQQLPPLSDEDELGLTPDDSAGDGKRKASPSPWQRMKWTDSMVKLLILAVLYIGDEAGSEGNDKKNTGALFQKKGKWKSVSRALMERGFFVSPQQCEDKFNDLNKRYKRVNEILGKGTACLVVENQILLDTMDLSPKMKEEVKKLLSSKHLFFKEMCAYHNNCGHGGGTSGATCANHSPEIATEPSQVQHQQAQQRCLHSSENAQHVVNLIRAETEGSNLVRAGSEVEDESEDESEDEDDEEDEAVGNSRAQNGHGQEDEDENDEKPLGKRPRKGRMPVPMSPLMQQLSYEVANVIQDSDKSAWEKKQWIKVKLLQLEEQQVSHQYQACELEKQRLKWVKFSTKKEREMKRAKLENERRRLENERMVLLVRQKELALLDYHHDHHHDHHHQQQHSSTKRSDPSPITG